MEPIYDLENRIREAHTIICEYEDKRLVESDPKDRRRFEQAVAEQWNILEGHLTEYFGICRHMHKAVPEDIRQIAAHFPQFLAEDFRQAYTTLRRVAPHEFEAFDQLTRVLRELGRLHEHLNEWKEMHNLLQECITALFPLKSEVEAAVEAPEHWRRTSGRRLWDPCRTKLRQLEVFARNIKYIDRPLHRDGGAIQGPAWMIELSDLKDNFEICLKEGDPDVIYDSILELWDACYDALFIADKRLRDMVSEVYMFSNAILRSVENDNQTE